MSLLGPPPLDFHIEANRAAAIERLRRAFDTVDVPDGQCWMLPDGAVLLMDEEHSDAFKLFPGSYYPDIFSLGCIRLIYTLGEFNVELSAPPTGAQISTLRRLVTDMRPEALYVDWLPTRWEERKFVVVGRFRSVAFEGRRPNATAFVNWIRQQSTPTAGDTGTDDFDLRPRAKTRE